MRTVNAKDSTVLCGHQQQRKYELQRANSNISGSCFWDAASAANNVGGYRDVLAGSYYRYPALMPRYPFIDNKAPSKLEGVGVVDDNGKNMLVWIVGEDAYSDVMDAPYRFVVYCFAKGERVNINNPANILEITSKTFIEIPESLEGQYTFVVTVLDRMYNESAGVSRKVRL